VSFIPRRRRPSTVAFSGGTDNLTAVALDWLDLGVVAAPLYE